MSKNTDYSNWSKPELVKEIKKLHERKKYGLVWNEEKTKEIFEKESQGKLPVLKDVIGNEINYNSKLNNILIEGDNYHTLSVLNYTHKNKIDVIYIDPPYNTGNKDFKFNDQYVDADNSYRHSKWLSFMSKRLKLASTLLTKYGIIFISIDDIEYAHLKLLCDEIFGESNFITNIVWQSKTGSSDAKTIDTVTEYILVYAKMKNNARFLKNVGAHKNERFRLKDEYVEERGRYYDDTLDRGGLRYSDTLNFPIKCPDGTSTWPNGRIKFEQDGWTWKWGKEKVNWGIKNGFINFKKSKIKKSGWTVTYKNYLNVDNEGNAIKRALPFKNIIPDIKTGDGAKKIKDIFGFQKFKYAKPVEFIIELLQMIDIPSNGIILDFMAGTGTTGEAVLQINKYKNTSYKFILCTNNECKICSDICYPRLKKVIKGYKNSKGKKIDGLKGNLKYFKTSFVNSEPTDQNRKNIVSQSTEMLCLKEDCFDLVKEGKQFKIFKNHHGAHIGIVYYYDGIDPFKKEVLKLKVKINTYVFSLIDKVDSEDFTDVRQWISLKPIPSAILNVYRRIYVNVRFKKLSGKTRN